LNPSPATNSILIKQLTTMLEIKNQKTKPACREKMAAPTLQAVFHLKAVP
jgi:hypothetical protein